MKCTHFSVWGPPAHALPQRFCPSGQEASSARWSEKRTEAASWWDSWITASAPHDWRWSWFVCLETCATWPTALGRCSGSRAPCLESFRLCPGRCQLPWWRLLFYQVWKDTIHSPLFCLLMKSIFLDSKILSAVWSKRVLLEQCHCDSIT